MKKLKYVLFWKGKCNIKCDEKGEKESGDKIETSVN